MAHDFNNLLQVITGNTELVLLDDLPTGHALTEELTEVQAAARQAERLVSQLLAFARRQRLQREAVDFNSVLQPMVTMLERLIGEHIQLTWEPAPEATVSADRGMVEQVLMNLCLNARDAMPNGGRLRIVVAVREVDAATAQSLAIEAGRYVQLEVHDTGTGMEPEVEARCFEPFFTTKGTGRGTGLGLPTVYGIVQQHDGIIEVRTAPSEGTTVITLWPAADANHELRPSSSELPEAAEGQETLLIAEDNALVRRMTRRFLERAGYRVKPSMVRRRFASPSVIETTSICWCST